MHPIEYALARHSVYLLNHGDYDGALTYAYLFAAAQALGI